MSINYLDIQIYVNSHMYYKCFLCHNYLNLLIRHYPHNLDYKELKFIKH